jgi:hypothetical protein
MLASLVKYDSKNGGMPTKKNAEKAYVVETSVYRYLVGNLLDSSNKPNTPVDPIAHAIKNSNI